ncbi:MAG: T9SS type A sorting domain-containing protein [Balneolales bacterium]|nr:T9SS type A sorting domain-containing protein [Balneolales bacterium]
MSSFYTITGSILTIALLLFSSTAQAQSPNFDTPERSSTFNKTAPSQTIADDVQTISADVLVDVGFQNRAGSSVDITDNWIAVGSMRESPEDTQFETGVVRLFKRNSDGDISEEQVLSPPIGGVRQFGYHVRFHQQSLFVSAPHSQAYVFVYQLGEDDEWVLFDTIENNANRFGQRMDMNTGTVVIGSMDGAFQYFYSEQNTDVQDVGPIEIPDYDGTYGYEIVALQTNVFAILSDDGVHIIEQIQGEYHEIHVIDLPEPMSDNPRHYRLASSGGLLAISDISYNDNTGKVFVYEATWWYDDWFLVDEITAPEGDSNSAFGTSLRFDGSKLLIGDVGRNAAYLYRLQTDYNYHLVAEFNTYQEETARIQDNQPALGIMDNLVALGNSSMQTNVTMGSVNNYIRGQAFYAEYESDFELKHAHTQPMRGGTRQAGFHWIRPSNLNTNGMGFITSGRLDSQTPETRYYGSTWTDMDDYIVVADIHADVNGVSWVALEDSDPLLLVSGRPGGFGNPYRMELYRINGSTAEKVDADLPNISGVVDWGDLTMNGQPDLVVSGIEGAPGEASRATKILLHEGDYEFREVTLNRTASDVVIGDFFNRGRNDIFLIGVNSTGDDTENIYIRNNSDGTFQVEQNDLTYKGVTNSSVVSAADLTNNGYLDLVIGGSATAEDDNALGIYYNNGDGTFDHHPFWTVITAVNTEAVSIDLVDINNNGWIDILYSSNNTMTRRSQTAFFMNKGDDAVPGESRFTTELPMIANPRVGGITAGDITWDGVNELIAYGIDNRGQRFMRTYTNNLATASYDRPGQVTDIGFSMDENNQLTLSWSEGSDNITPTSALTYNVRVGTTPESDDIVNSNSHGTGVLFNRGPGNVGSKTSYTLPDLSELPDDVGTIYARVSVVNQHRVASVFAGTTWRQSDQFLSMTNADVPRGTTNLFPNWVDVNRDGKLNLVIRKQTEGENILTPFSIEEGVFSPMESNIEGNYGFWGDFTNNGWPDVMSRESGGILRVWENNDGNFAASEHEISQSVTMVTPFDHNLNGKQDVIVATGSLLSSAQSRILINEGDGLFVQDDTTFGRAFSVDAADYNKNGCQDLLMARFGALVVYENDCYGEFHIVDTLHTYSDVGEAIWADLTANGYPDVILSVTPQDADFDEVKDLYIYRNTGNGFEQAEHHARFGLINPAAIDVTGNGYLDVIINGQAGSASGGSLLFNNGDGTFTLETESEFDTYREGAIAPADVFRTGKADFYIHGNRFVQATQRFESSFYRNMRAQPHEPAGEPLNLSVHFDEDEEAPTFSWIAGEEGSTPNSGLTYNLRVGSEPGANDIVSGLALEDGTRLVAKRGNVGSVNSITMHGLELEEDATYYWSVQAIDNVYNGSAFAPEQSFVYDVLVSIDQDHLPREVTLAQNYPNPFNPVTTIQFSLPTEEHVTLTVYDITGRQVAQVSDALYSAGHHSIGFDGSRLASGVYIYQLRTQNQTLTRKMSLIK